LEEDESTVLEQFFDYIKSEDPDILIFGNHDLNVLNYLLQRTKLLSLDLNLGRKKTDIYSLDQRKVLERWSQGRVYFTNRHPDNGLTGLIEFSCKLV
jgi:DNA polymerase elongation subunit (family B)